jgi:hypothetical protein
VTDQVSCPTRGRIFYIAYFNLYVFT